MHKEGKGLNPITGDCNKHFQLCNCFRPFILLQNVMQYIYTYMEHQDKAQLFEHITGKYSDN